VTLEFHPLADIFPLIEGYEFAGLVEDIRKNGLREPVVMFRDKVLDGRNRLRACEAAGVARRFETYTGDDPISYVISLNLRRRHLDESQRAMVAAKLANLRDGQRADLVEGLPIGRASDLLSVGERSVSRAREVQEHGAPELVRAVEQGQVSVSAAADVATLSTDNSARLSRGASGKSSRQQKRSGHAKEKRGAPSASKRWREFLRGMRNFPARGSESSTPIRLGNTSICLSAIAGGSKTITRPCRSPRFAP